MDLGHFRKFGSHRIVGRPAFLLLIFWFGYLFWDYEPNRGAWDNDEVRMLYFERELLLLEAGEDQEGILRWLSGASQGAEAYRNLEASLPKKKADENWQIDFARQLIAQKIAQAEGREIRPIQWQDGMIGHSAVGNENYPAYVLEALNQMQKLPGAKGRLAGFKEEILLRNLHSVIPELLLMGLAIALAICTLRRRSHEKVLPQKRIFELWSPAVLITIFVVASMTAGWIYRASSSAFIFLQLEGWAPWIWLDFLWRALPACVLMFYFFGTPGAAIRSFRLNQMPSLREGIIALGFSLCVSWLIYELDLSDEIDPTDWISVSNPVLMDHVWDIMSSVIAAPIFEEIVFRGFLFCGLRPHWGNWKAALFSTVLFAVIHVQYDIWGMFSVGFFGLVCCWLVVRTRSLTTGILIHALLNGFIFWWTWMNYHRPL